MKKIFCLLLSLLLLLSTLSIGCGKIGSGTRWEDISTEEVTRVEMGKAFRYLGVTESWGEAGERRFSLSVTAECRTVWELDSDGEYGEIVYIIKVEHNELTGNYRYERVVKYEPIEGGYPEGYEEYYSKGERDLGSFDRFNAMAYELRRNEFFVFWDPDSTYPEVKYVEDDDEQAYYEVREENRFTERDRVYKYKFKDGKLVAAQEVTEGGNPSTVIFYDYNNTTVDLG